MDRNNGSTGQAAIDSAAPNAGNLKAQAAIEVLSYAAFFLLAFVATIAVFFQLQNQEISRAEHAYAQEIAYGFADNIRTAFIAGTGFSQKVRLEPNLLGKPYTIRVSRASEADTKETGFVYVEWESSGRSAVVSAPTVTASYDLTGWPGFIHTNGSSIQINPSAETWLNMKNTGGTVTFKKG